MQYIKSNVLHEAERLVRGKQTRVPAWLICSLLLDTVKGGTRQRVRDDEVQFLDRLYALPDSRAEL